MTTPNLPQLPGTTAFNPASHWPAPDMSLLNPTRGPAPQMTPEMFRWIYGAWADWIETAATSKGAPRDYVALPLLVAASALLGNSRWVSPWHDWEEPPVIWGMVIGNPSAGKSPALNAIIAPLREIEATLAEAYAATLHDWNGKNELAKLVAADWKETAKKALRDHAAPPERPCTADAGPAPVRERIYVVDTTTEKMAELLSETGRGLLAYRDELSGWLGGMDRYSDGGDRPFWLECTGGRAFTVDRKSADQPIIIDRLSVAVLGGIQPDKLNGLLVKSADDGLLARFLVVFPDPAPLARPSQKLDTSALKVAFERLRALPPVTDETGKAKPWLLRFDPDAQEEMHQFRVANREWEAKAEGLYLSHIGKLPGMVARVACILAHLDWVAQPGGSAPATIAADQFCRAKELVGGHLRLHALRAYGSESVAPEIKGARRLADLIHSERLPRFTVREIQRRNLSRLTEAKAIRAALGVLMEADWVREETESTGGRPRHVYLVNPRTWSEPLTPDDTVTKAAKSPSPDLLSGSVDLSLPGLSLPPLPPIASQPQKEK